jgi:cell wall-associated NlpC family hydrolase
VRTHPREVPAHSRREARAADDEREGKKAARLRDVACAAIVAAPMPPVRVLLQQITVAVLGLGGGHADSMRMAARWLAGCGAAPKGIDHYRLRDQMIATGDRAGLQRYAYAYQFSGGPGGEITLNPRVCPAQKADGGNASGATGVVQASLTPQQRCVAAAVILYAAEQLGKPYQWGGTGPDAFDSSGLAMMAYRAAGIAIPRTSQQQWAAGPRVPPGWAQPGDLVFFAGSDGTPQDPGHVGIVIGDGEMIEAYAADYPIRVATYGESSSPPGDQVVIGFTRPG